MKTCTVSEAEETARRVEARLKAILNIREGYVPRLNWNSFDAEGMEKMRMIVPLSEAVAIRVPLSLIDKHEIGAR